MSARYLWGIAAVYGAALLQGMALVSFPASSAALRSLKGFTDAQYGAIFLPQVALAIVGSVLGGSLAARVGLRALLVAAMIANAASQVALAGASQLDPEMAYVAILVGTGTMGLGFGLLGAPMNAYPPLFFPHRRDTALVAVHTLVGIGLMAGPLLFVTLQSRGWWVVFPLLLLAACGAFAGLASGASLPLPKPAPVSTSSQRPPFASPVFWSFFAIAVIYAFAEGTFSNWIVVYLQDGRGLPAATAAAALSAFWGALVAGRLLVSALVLRIAPHRVWIVLPALMAIAFLALPHATTPVLAIGLFVLAGLACSAFFPLSIALVSERFPAQVPWVSSMMIAALMSGVGIGSFAVGALRSRLSFDALYTWSALYPVAVLGLAVITVLRRPRPRMAMA
ncbi:MAG TPA: MFS transporter [Nevskiaceae bacterium]|nr:MFS transporter [Nevskiaceae bacterium]